MATDAELVALWADGDRAAANELFERHFASVYRFFRSKVGVGVEDLVQETFAAAVVGRDRLRETSSFRGYLFGVARNLLRQHFRTRRVHGEHVDLGVQSVEDLCPGLSSAMGKRAEHKLLTRALTALPVDYQIALELFYWEKLSGPELGDVLGLKEPAVRSRLRRAKLALRKQMEDAAESAALVESTWNGLDQWANEVAGHLAPSRR